MKAVRRNSEAITGSQEKDSFGIGPSKFITNNPRASEELLHNNENVFRRNKDDAYTTCRLSRGPTDVENLGADHLKDIRLRRLQEQPLSNGVNDRDANERHEFIYF